MAELRHGHVRMEKCTATDDADFIETHQVAHKIVLSVHSANYTVPRDSGMCHL